MSETATEWTDGTFVPAIEETEVTLADLFSEAPETFKTPYAIRTFMNGILKSLGIDKELPGPMFYTYVKKGYIKSLSKEDVLEWAEKYIAKNFS